MCLPISPRIRKILCTPHSTFSKHNVPKEKISFWHSITHEHNGDLLGDFNLSNCGTIPLNITHIQCYQFMLFIFTFSIRFSIFFPFDIYRLLRFKNWLFFLSSPTYMNAECTMIVWIFEIWNDWVCTNFFLFFFSRCVQKNLFRIYCKVRT